jgi:hypothetical protein
VSRPIYRALAFAFVFALVSSGLPTGLDRGVAAAVTPSITVTPTTFGAGQIVTVNGTGFAPAITVNVWFDFNGNLLRDGSETSTAVVTDANGSFSGVTLTVQPESVFLGIHKVSPGAYFIRAEGPAATIASASINVGTCWIQDQGCTINGLQWICLVGDAPRDTISDCKAIDSNYSDPITHPNGYDFTNVGPRFLGAGVLAAAAVSVNPLPFSGCAAMASAITVASNPPYNNVVPDQNYVFAPHHGLLSTACGVPQFGIPPLDLPLYATFATAEALLPRNHGLPDPALDDAAVVGAVVATTQAAAAAAEALQPGAGVTVLFAAQQTLAAAAVAGDIACGFVNYYCNGSDITANIIGHPGVQTALVPYKLDGQRWGDIIGWAQVVCHSNVVPPPGAKGDCETPATLPVPGSAGPFNILAVPIKCATGPVIGLSIGYDGDVSFDVNDSLVDPKLGPGPGIAELTNYHNFQPGPGGSESPAGIDIEVPLADRAIFLPKLAQLRIGTKVKVCGRWVADMHQFWNELHPVTSLDILDTTPPVITPSISGTLGANGWYTSDVDVSWTVVDAESAITTRSGCDPTSITADTAGMTLTCAATSQGGDSSRSVTIKRDATNPTISAASTTPANLTGWNNTDVNVHFSCADALSGIAPGACPADESLTAEGGAVSSTARTVADRAGNVSSPSNVVTAMIDKTPPTINASATTSDGATYSAGTWTNRNVTVHYACADGLSGIATCGPDQVLSLEGTSTSSGVAEDVAGNLASASFGPIRIDKTPPTILFVGNLGRYDVDQTILITCVASDALSGIAATSCPPVASGPATQFVGPTSPTTTTLTATASDNAGNATSANTSFTVTVTAAGICRLTATLQTSHAICAHVTSIANAPNSNAKAGKLGALDSFLAAQTGKSIPPVVADLIRRLAHLL